MKKFIPLIAVFLFLVVGCGTVPMNKGMYAKYLTRSYDYPKDKVFDATLAVFKDRGVGIENQDKENGIIITQKAKYAEEHFVIPNRVTGYSSEEVHIYWNKYYFQIIGTGNKAIIKSDKHQIWSGQDGLQELTKIRAEFVAENYWNPLFNDIQKKLEAM